MSFDSIGTRNMAVRNVKKVKKNILRILLKAHAHLHIMTKHL